MLQHKRFLVGYKVFFALLGFGAIVTEIATLVERGVFRPFNFFSYFTIETNILVVITLLLSALALAAGKRGRFDTLRGATAVYILVVGIGFTALLSHVEGLVLTAMPWDNIVLHYIIPVAVLIDFAIDRPRRAFAFKNCLVWLLFPAVYITYALTRGALTGWYPYPFLNPATKGYGSVVLVVASLFALGLVLIWGTAKYTSIHKRR